MNPDIIGKRVFLATPWKFSDSNSLVRFFREHEVSIESYCNTNDFVPGFITYLIFLLQNFDKNIKKYSQKDYPELREVPDKDLFFAIEKWLSSSPDMPSFLTSECITKWCLDDCPSKGKWYVNDHLVCPKLPNRLDSQKYDLVIYALRDHLVSPDSAHALVLDIEDSEYVTYDTGHIGLMTSREWAPAVRDKVIGFLSE
jgi:poly(3-hydroxyalkanoate) synthetase